MKQKQIEQLRTKLLLAGYEARPHVNNTLLITGERANEIFNIGKIARNARISVIQNGTLLEF